MFNENREDDPDITIIDLLHNLVFARYYFSVTLPDILVTMANNIYNCFMGLIIATVFKCVDKHQGNNDFVLEVFVFITLIFQEFIAILQ